MGCIGGVWLVPWRLQRWVSKILAMTWSGVPLKGGYIPGSEVCLGSILVL